MNYQTEEKILDYWRKNKIFEKSVKKSVKGKTLKKDAQGSRDFIFYDGPPFANGLPHYGHIIGNILKDVIPRYKTMKGYSVPRRWGWDCHGLPVENEIEKELGLKSKKDIEKFGIEKFNEAARTSILKYVDHWKKIIPHIGRWVDMENSYKTMDPEYMESILWVFKSLYDKGLIYEGYKPMHICPRCETTLANFEVTQNYKDISDISVFVKFKLNPDQKIGDFKTDENTYIIAWTTTPWTLPGNVALAIGEDIRYRKFKIKETKDLLKKGDVYIVMSDFFIPAYSDSENRSYEGPAIIQPTIKKRLFEYTEIEDIEEFDGRELKNISYKPLFDYYQKDENLKNRENGWKIYGADFVNTEEGTGIVHIAPAFGEDDMKLGKQYNLPFVQPVSMSGEFKNEVKDFVGLQVKPKDTAEDKDAHLRTDLEIIKWLQEKGSYFDKQKIIHSYPHCWRCETPLLNYAASSWFVKVEEIKEKLINNNKQINWIPEHIKEGRFGKWLEGARDWAISRSRFWGTPLPIWKCKKCDNIKTIGSINELKKYSKKSGNKYFIMRHGQAESNLKNFISSKFDDPNHLTGKGETQIISSAKKLKKEKIDFIFSSDFLRTKETAEIVLKEIGLNKKSLIFDKRLREINTGVFHRKKPEDYHSYFSSSEEKFTKTPPEGENLSELKNRVTEFLYEIEEKYSDKNILIISHEYPVWCLFAGAQGADIKKAVLMKKGKPDFIKNGEVLKLDFIPLPHNKNFEIDLHRPYIDKIELPCVCGEQMKRIPEVFDCWFESGSMPYGQAHYPFENKNKFEKNFPAEFIAEGLDQTRGWFYTLLVLSTALFDKPAYKNVIVNGTILAEDGQKMSKRLRNYPDPIEMINKYGADAVRFYLISSPAVQAENLNFSEKGVGEINNKIISKLENVYKFYELYADKQISNINTLLNSLNDLDILDKWILSRLHSLIEATTATISNYKLDLASRSIAEFIDDFSNWYVRRSRQRLQYPENQKSFEQASSILYYILLELSKICAPFMPFISEEIYLSLNKITIQQSANKSKIINKMPLSIHLCEYPESNNKIIDEKLNKEMTLIREISALGLKVRAKSQIKVRQPLAFMAFNYPSLDLNQELLNLLKEELNIKQIEQTKTLDKFKDTEGFILENEGQNQIALDIRLNQELKEEGLTREIIRQIQDLRKNANLTPKNLISLYCFSDNAYFNNLISKFDEIIRKQTFTEKIETYQSIEQQKENIYLSEGELKIDDMKLWIGIK